MIEAGEDPRFLARRMVILASEDIGLADPQALLVAEAAARAVEYVGLPEAALNLAEAVIYLARAPKSNAVVVALGRAQADVRSSISQEVPAHLRDAHYKGASSLGHGEGYVYPHDDPSGVVLQQYRPDALEGRVYYEPSPHGAEGVRSSHGQGGPFVNRGHRRGALRGGGPGRASRSAPESSLPCVAARRRRRPSRPRWCCPRRCRTSPPTRLGWVRRRPTRSSTSTSPWPDRTRPAWRRRWPQSRPPARPTTGTTSPRRSTPRSSARAPTEVAQVSSALRAEGLTVGTPDPGSILLPVSGTAAVVSAAFGTPLESVQPPNRGRVIVNTAAPQIPASLAGSVTGVVGLDGLFQEHSMLRPKAGQSPTPSSGAHRHRPSAGAGAQNHDLVAHAPTPQACPAAQASAFGGTYTSTQMASIFGLDQLFGQGRIGLGQTIAIVEFEQYRRATSQRSSPATGCPARFATSSSTAGREGHRPARARPRSTPSWRPSTRQPPRSSCTRHRTTTMPRPSTCSTASPATTPPRSSPRAGATARR